MYVAIRECCWTGELYPGCIKQSGGFFFVYIENTDGIVPVVCNRVGEQRGYVLSFVYACDCIAINRFFVEHSVSVYFNSGK